MTDIHPCGSWDRASPFLDPMCGSGTLPIEADLWARAVAPGLLRHRFGFERWAMHDGTAAGRMAILREMARAAVRPEGPPVFGGDLDPRALELCAANARRAGARVAWRCRAVADMQRLVPPGTIVANPPYGHRLDADQTAWEDLAHAMKRLRGHRVGVLAGDRAIERAMRRRPDRFQLVFNGDIECKFLVFDL